MTHGPAIIEAAEQALRDSLGNTLLPILNRHIASIVLTTVTPLIEVDALERAAKVAEDSVAYTNTSPHQLWMGDQIAARIRALKEKP